MTDRVDADYLGINHLGWLRALRVSGTDLLPGLLRRPGRLARDRGRAAVRRGPASVARRHTERVPVLVLRARRGAARRPGRRADPRRARAGAAAGVLRRRGGGAGRGGSRGGGPAGPASAAALWQAANDERNRSYFAELRTGERAGERDEADVAAGGYESVAIALASALSGGPAARLILNVRNGDTVPALPPDMVIEVPCRVDASGAVPLPVSAPTAHQLGLMAAVRSCERDIADAALLAAGWDLRRRGLRRRPAAPQPTPRRARSPRAARVRDPSPGRLARRGAVARRRRLAR